MGSGIVFHCDDCSKEYKCCTGVGRRYSDTNEKVKAYVAQGVFGDEWKELLDSNPDMLLDSSLCLYLCPVCQHWETEYNLSLDKPCGRDDEQRWACRSIDDHGVVTGVLNGDVLRRVRERVHYCGECGSSMLDVDEPPFMHARMKCPDCGKPMPVVSTLRWD